MIYIGRICVVLGIALLGLAMLACTAPNGTLTPEEQAARDALIRQQAIDFAVGRVNSAIALGIIDIEPARVTMAQLFIADTACAGMRLMMLQYPDATIPVGHGPFCQQITHMIQERAGAIEAPAA